MKPRSHGRVRLSSREPSTPPAIDLGYFSEAQDTVRLLEGLRIARQLADTPPFSTYTRQPLSAAARAPDTTVDLVAALRADVATYHHPVGTCHMGPDTDPSAVVDERGRVRGLENLFVVDASIMPTIPAANTNLTTLMLAERCAAWLARK